MNSINPQGMRSLTPHPDTRIGPIPGKPATFRTAARGSASPVEQQAKRLLKSFDDASKLPDANRPASLFAPSRAGRESLLVTFCKSVNAKAHAFLIQVLVPVIDQLAQRIDAAGPDESGAAKDWKRSAGRHLVAGADAALQAKNPKSLAALLDVAVKHFPDDVPDFIVSRLTRHPKSLATFLAAGIRPEVLESLLAAEAPAPAAGAPLPPPPPAAGAAMSEPASVAAQPLAVAPPAAAAAAPAPVKGTQAAKA